MESARIIYNGSTPGADSAVYVLMSTVVAFPGVGMVSDLGYKRLFVTIDNPQSGTVKLYRCNDGLSGSTTARGTNWVQVGGDFAATSSATDVTTLDLLIEGFPDFKLEWTNAGSAQTGWTVTMALTSQRSAAV